MKERTPNREGFLEKLKSHLPVDTIQEIIKALMKAYEDGKKVITMGNGGHGSTASHLINDLAKHTVVSDEKDKVIVKGKRFKTLCLNDNMATLTSWANDVGYQDCFSEQLSNWVEEGDVVIAITGSGNSQNMLNAFEPNFRRSPVHKHSLPTERHFSKSKCVTDTFSSSSVGEPDENWRSAEVGFEVAKKHGATTIALTGYQGGKVKDVADICFIVPSDNISFIEDVHMSLTHMWCDIIRKTLQEKYCK